MQTIQYFTQKSLPLIQKQMIYMTGAADLELDIEEDITVLSIEMHNFELLLNDILLSKKEFSQTEIETLYNNIYLLLELFKKIAKRLEENQYIKNSDFMEKFKHLINTLKAVRKQLLQKLEGELAVVIQKNTYKVIHQQV